MRSAFDILFSLDTERCANLLHEASGRRRGLGGMGLIDEAYRLDFLRGSFAYDGRLAVEREIDRQERACIHYCVEHSFVCGGCEWSQILVGDTGATSDGKKIGQIAFLLSGSRSCVGGAASGGC